MQCIPAQALNSEYASQEVKDALQGERRTLLALEGLLRDRMLSGGPSRAEIDAVLAQRQRVEAALQRVYQEGHENAPKLPAFLMKQAD